MQFNKNIIYSATFILCLIYSNYLVAEQQSLQVNNSNEKSRLREASGLLMLDYESISLKGGGKFDLFGVHYLHQLNDWLYFGIGINGPVVEGNYGGFFVVDTTLHAKKRLFGNWYVDAGISFGGGGGGESVEHVKELSGSGQYSKKYLGFGYKINDHYFGINYAEVNLSRSPINDFVINFYYQKPFSFSIGSFSDAGKTVASGNSRYREYDSLFSFELNNLSQIKPTGSYEDDIGTVSPQFSQFYSDNNYFYFGFDLGYTGLDWYNQIHGGIGHRMSISPKINLYAQLGIGTGGWVTDTIQTGPGLLIYPKLKVEYILDNNVGLSLSAGYLAAPKGTSKNWTVGAGINFPLFADKPRASGRVTNTDLALSGFRFNIFYNSLFDVSDSKQNIDNFEMQTVQLDYLLNENWYVPFQVSAATSVYKDFAGYVEMYLGLGWQSNYLASDKFQSFVQILYGINDVGVSEAEDVGPLLNVSFGVNYSLSDHVAIYAQLSKTVSVNQYTKSNYNNYFKSSSFGIGITYRFSLPNRASK